MTKCVRGSTTETERRSREVLLLLNIIEPDPVYQATIFDDIACALDVSPNSEPVVRERLQHYFGCPFRASMLRMPLWQLVDAILEMYPGWPEVRQK